jgi:leucyl aminopeptidase (aminopeptidase T)
MEKERLAKNIYGGNLVFRDGKIVTFTEEEIEEHIKKWNEAEKKNGAM